MGWGFWNSTCTKTACWPAREIEAGAEWTWGFALVWRPREWGALLGAWSLISCSCLCSFSLFPSSPEVTGDRRVCGEVGLVAHRVQLMGWGCWSSLPLLSYFLTKAFTTACQILKNWHSSKIGIQSTTRSTSTEMFIGSGSMAITLEINFLDQVKKLLPVSSVESTAIALKIHWGDLCSESICIQLHDEKLQMMPPILSDDTMATMSLPPNTRTTNGEKSWQLQVPHWIYVSISY